MFNKKMTQITRSNGRIYTLKKDKNRYFLPEELEKVFEMAHKRLKHSIICQFNTGARINEIRHVVPSQDIIVADEKRLITLRHTKAKSKKGERVGRVRTIPISTQFYKYLKSGGWLKKDTFGIISTPGVSQGLKLTAKRIGLHNPEDFSSHSIRKTFEVYLMVLGVGDMRITMHLGHDIRTAVSHYVSPDIFSSKQKWQMRDMIGDLYEK